MSWRHMRAVIRKEIHHIMRDRMTFILVMLTPVMLLFLMVQLIQMEAIQWQV